MTLPPSCARGLVPILMPLFLFLSFPLLFVESIYVRLGVQDSM